MPKDTFFCQKNTINCNGELLDLSTPIVMGVINVTPDSFYKKSRFESDKAILKEVKKMLNDGAAIIDIGGYSTRPGADSVDEEEEIKRTIPIIKSIQKEFPNAKLSIDTFRCKVAEMAITEGASIINDVSGGIDPKMFETAAKLRVPYILTHIKGNLETMQIDPTYENLLSEIYVYFSTKINELRNLGVNDIILDPGFGFGKTIENNYELLSKLETFKIFEVPLLTGFSRKSMIYKLLNTTPENSLNGTTVCNTIALQKGANILRVHDVKEAKEAINMINQLQIYA